MFRAVVKRRPSPAMVVALIALFVSLGPTAYATHLVVRSSDVVDNSLKGVDIQNGSLRSADLASGAVASADIAPDAVDATKIPNDGSGSDNVNATSLDGKDSTAFADGPGAVISRATVVTPGDFLGIFTAQQVARIGYQVGYRCRDTEIIRFDNHSGGTVNLFVDDGGANPVHVEVANYGSYDVTANLGGEGVTFQAQGAKIATIHVFSLKRAGDCHAQAQAIVTP